MELPEMESVASAIGISVPVFRFLLCFAATIPVSFFHRLVPGGPVARHLYAAMTGAVLSYLSFGLSSNLHFLVPMFLGYASMVLCRKYCGTITFFSAFGYLIGWYLTFSFAIFTISDLLCWSLLGNLLILFDGQCISWFFKFLLFCLFDLHELLDECIEVLNWSMVICWNDHSRTKNWNSTHHLKWEMIIINFDDANAWVRISMDLPFDEYIWTNLSYLSV